MTGLLLLAMFIGSRILWEARPGIVSCALFWAVALLFAYHWIRYVGAASLGIRWCRSVATLGIICNATVTLANGGLMPAVGQEEARRIWVPASDTHHLLWLADRFAGCSVGDLILFPAAALAILLTLCHMVGPSPPGRIGATVATQVGPSDD